MQVAIISDIHANAAALRALSDILARADVVLCLGDLVGYYCEVNEAIDLVRSYDPICVLGNHDYFLLHGCPADASDHVKWAIDYADNVITGSHRDYLAAMPHIWGGEVDRDRFLLSHGSPWRPLTDYLYHDKCDMSALRQFDVDVIAFGQTHRPWADENGQPLIINAGSVGQSRHLSAVACAVTIDLSSRDVQIVEKPYDPTRVIELARKCGAKDWVLKHIAVP